MYVIRSLDLYVKVSISTAQTIEKGSKGQIQLNQTVRLLQNFWKQRTALIPIFVVDGQYLSINWLQISEQQWNSAHITHWTVRNIVHLL